MRLLFFDSIDKETFGGYENWILLAARHMSQRGHDVTVAGRPDSEYLRRAGQLGDAVRLLEVPISGDFNPATIARMKAYLEQNKIDLMTVNFNKDLRLGGLAARWHGRTRVVWRIGLDVTRDSWAHHFFTPKLIDGVIVPSNGLKRQVIRHGYLPEDLVTVIHNGSEVVDFRRPNADASNRIHERYDLPDSATIAVSVGRLVDQKGHIYLVEAAGDIVARHGDIRFLWLGNGPNEDMLRRRIDELGLNDYFIFAGMLDDVTEELAGSDLMIHAAVEEPFSHGVIECMRAGLPIVATRVGGTPEAVMDGETGLLVEAREPKPLAEAVNRMLDDCEAMLAYGLAGQKRWRELFTVDVMIDKTEAYFQSVLDKERVDESA